LIMWCNILSEQIWSWLKLFQSSTSKGTYPILTLVISGTAICPDMSFKHLHYYKRFIFYCDMTTP
jgi:hypothetical protein